MEHPLSAAAAVTHRRLLRSYSLTHTYLAYVRVSEWEGGVSKERGEGD